MLIRVAIAVLFVTTPLAAQNWQPLFNGFSLDGWTAPDGQPVTADAWKIEAGGVLHLDRSAGHGGNILTDRDYGDFELVFEWNISEKGNNGIKYRVRDYGKQTLGLEYQILDDAAFPKLTREHLTASLYDLVTPIPAMTRLNPVGQYNVGKIRVQCNHVQHWINGQLMIDEYIGSERWKSHVADSKFRDREDFGENPSGRLMLTDHGAEVWFRNMFIRRL
ncbi:MAG: DUF1080 domain-containing protein [Planctomycetales bacterium]|nr:DUF1080 domain-containing protein [Planctomycetales bacterium]